jgi:hypothetical protein
MHHFMLTLGRESSRSVRKQPHPLLPEKHFGISQPWERPEMCQTGTEVNIEAA